MRAICDAGIEGAFDLWGLAGVTVFSTSVDASVGAREIFKFCIARSQVLTSVRPLMRPIDGRGPVWEFADRIQITDTRSRRSVENWLADPVSH